MNFKFFSYDKLGIREFSGLSTYQFLVYFRRALFYTFLSIYLRNVLGLSTTQTTLMATIGMIANTASQIFLWGPLLDKTKKSALFVGLGEGVAGLGHFIIFLWHRQSLATGDALSAGFSIIFGLALVEIFWSMSNNGWTALISEYTSDNERKQLMSQLSLLGGFGGVVGATIGGELFKSGIGFSEGSIFQIAGYIMILSSFIVLLTIKNPSTQEDGSKENLNHKFSELDPIIRKAYLTLLISLIFIHFGRNSMAIITSIFLDDVNGFAATDRQIALFRNIGSIATMITSGILGTVLARVNDWKIFMVGVWFSIFSHLWMVISPSFNWVLLASIFNEAGFVIIFASSYAIASKLIPVEMRGRLFAYFNTTLFLSWGIPATFITGPVADYLIIYQNYLPADAYKVSYIIATIILLIGVVFLVYLRKLLLIVIDET